MSDLFKKAMLQNIQSGKQIKMCSTFVLIIFRLKYSSRELACQFHSTDYIHNGELARDGEFPWMVQSFSVIIFAIRN